jgi:uncharacterized protein with NRDE domain
MCTVTFIPKPRGGFILTSNRDEAPDRRTINPKGYTLNGVDLVFPKDDLAGGTWLGWSAKKRVICLLNGGVTAHERKSIYRLSRGIVVTELLASEEILLAVDVYNFDKIEPFTLVIVDWSKELALYELVWDGSTLHFSEKSLSPMIWSSSSLYSSEVKRKREAWFSNFIFKNVNPSEEALLAFHKTAGEGSIKNDLIMDRGFVKTKSITQLSKSKLLTCRYENLETSEIDMIEFSHNGVLNNTI